MLTTSQRIKQFRPALEDEMLLKAIFLAGDAQKEAYKIWRRVIDIEDISAANANLLPLLSSRGAIEESDPLAEIAKEIHQKTLRVNSSIVESAFFGLAKLRAAKIPVMLLKGATISLVVHEDNGLRPLSAIDIAVPMNFAKKAMRILESNSWKMRARANKKLGRIMLEQQGEWFVASDKAAINLHWNLYFTSRQKDLDDSHWQRAEDHTFENLDLKILAAEEQFLHTCVHGVSDSPRNNINWIADVISIVEKNTLDWEHIVTQATERQLGLQIKDVCHYLYREFGVAIPVETIHGLDQLEEDPKEYILYSYYSWSEQPQVFLDTKDINPDVLAKLVCLWRKFCISLWSRKTKKQCESMTTVDKLSEFAHYLYSLNTNTVPRYYS